MPRSQCTVAVAQINPRLGDVDANLALHADRAAAARRLGADLVVFPELALTGYFLKDMVPAVALRLDEEADDYRFYNSAAYLHDGAIVHVHRKAYLPTYGLFDEARYLARGDRIRSFDAPFGRSALLICEDLWHPSTVYVAALDHALTVICPSSSPLRGVRDGEIQDDNARYWELLNAVYARTYGMHIIYANRVGFEDGVGFWGGSEIVDPTGTRLAKAKYYDEDLIVAGLDLQVVRRQRLAAPLLRDEDVDLTINELLRIRGRLAEAGAVSAARPARRRTVRRARGG